MSTRSSQCRMRGAAQTGSIEGLQEELTMRITSLQTDIHRLQLDMCVQEDREMA
jgi:hypothetical protein